MNRRCAFLLILLAGAAGAHASGFPSEPSPAVVQAAPPSLPAEPDRWLPFRVFDWRDGLGYPVNSLTLDRQGYLWIGNSDGASFYNGQSWRRVGLPTDPPDTDITRFLRARDGSLWIGTRTKGIFRLDQGVWSKFPLDAAGLVAPAVHDFLETAHGKRGVIWAATSRGIIRCEAEACLPLEPLRGSSVRGLAPARGNDGRPALWVAMEKGLVRLDGIEAPAPFLAPVLFDHRNALPVDSVRSIAASTSPEGRLSLWVGTDQGLARLRDGLWTRYDHRAGFPASSVAALLPGRWNGRPVVWAATFGAGLICIDEEDGRWEVFDTSVGLPANYLYTLLATDSGAGEPTLWIATTGGLARLEPRRWHSFDSRAGLPSDTVVGVGEDLFPDGRTSYWAGTVNGTVRLEESGWKPFLPFPGASSPVVLDIVWSREGQRRVFWMATAQGLFRHDRGAWTLALPAGQAYSLETIPSAGSDASAEGDEVWARSPFGVARLANGRWSTFRSGSGGLPGGEIHDLAWSPAGRQDAAVWAGTDAGLARFASGHWQEVAVPCLPHRDVLALGTFADAEGNGWLWAGTQRGAARVRLAGGMAIPGDCQSLTAGTHQQLANLPISQIISDQAGRIYLFSDQGVARLAIPAGGTLESVRPEVFSKEDGLPGIRFTRARFRDHRGRIWSGSSAGIAIFDPSYEARGGGLPRPAPLRIERVLVEGRDRSLGARLELQGRKERLEIEYALLRFQREHATRFRTQLAGLEDRPSEWNREARAVYDRLPSGDYVFRVWGRDGNGMVSGPAELRFFVLPPLWLTPWAFALYPLALGGLVYGAVRLRVRTLARRAAQLEAQVAERTRDLAEANRRLELASFTDPLTGLNNRRYLTATIQPDVVQAIRNYREGREGREPEGDPHRRDLVVYLLDLDHFKRLNDRAGHAAGDTVLVEVARRLRRVVRASDLVVRWGGEEVLVVSRWTDRKAGALLAERLLEATGGEPFRTGADRTSTVTCSVGWAPFPWSTEDPDAVLFEEVLSLADHALYLAKREGRNRAVGIFPGTADAEEVAERILREDAPLHSLEGLQVELVTTPGPQVAAEDRTTTVRDDGALSPWGEGRGEGDRIKAGSPLTPSGPDAMLRGPI